MSLSEWRKFPSAPCLAGKKNNLLTARVSMLLKSRASLRCFRACFLPGRAKDLSASRYTAVNCDAAVFSFIVYTLLLLLLLLFTEIQLSFGGSSPYTGTDKINENI